MRAICSLLMVIGLSVSFLGAGCGKDEAGAAPAAKGSAPAASGAPTKEAVAALDCAKACTQDGECIKKHGMNVHESHQRDCTQSCDWLKGLYDPEKHGAAMARLTKLAAGQCE